MHTELTNLLPNDRIRSFRHEYFFRLLTVFMVACGLLVFAWGALLFPSYIYLSTTIAAKNKTITALGDAFQNADQHAADAELSALVNNAAYLNSLSKVSGASAALAAILAVPRPSIRVTGFSFVPPRGNVAGTLIVSGVAASRDALRSYNLALGTVPGVVSADLPVSAYAKESNIAFTITLTGTFQNPLL